MGFLTRIFAVRAMHSQRDVRERAMQVMDRVIFDLGVDRFVQGTFRLDRHCRPRFSSGAVDPGGGGIAVALAQLAECAALGAAARGDAGPHAMHACRAAVVEGLLREFRARSARFRALPVAGPDTAHALSGDVARAA